MSIINADECERYLADVLRYLSDTVLTSLLFKCSDKTLSVASEFVLTALLLCVYVCAVLRRK